MPSRLPGQLSLLALACISPFAGFYAFNQSEGIDPLELAIPVGLTTGAVLAAYGAYFAWARPQTSRLCCVLALGVIAGLAVHAPHARMTVEDCVAQLPKVAAAAERLGVVWASGTEDGAGAPA